VKHVTFKVCLECGGHATVLQGGGGKQVCMDCIDHQGPPHRYVCSIEGCGNQPIYLAVMAEEGSPSVLVCERHFPDVMDRIRSYLDLPPWLTNGNNFHLGDGGVVFEFDVGTRVR
jgi:hypothetical protein